MWGLVGSSEIDIIEEEVGMFSMQLSFAIPPMPDIMIEEFTNSRQFSGPEYSKREFSRELAKKMRICLKKKIKNFFIDFKF